MLVFFFSDRNYELSGFKASYSVTQCLYNCSDNGLCRNHHCFCHTGFSGVGCQISSCPSSCRPHGRCDRKGYCVCDEGYDGPDCNSTTNSTLAQNTWYQITADGRGFTPRASHSSVFLSGCIWIFGGTTLNRYLNDLVRYNLTSKRWETIPPLTFSFPTPRYKHAMVGVSSRIYVFGGKLSDESLTNELWMYDIDSGMWFIEGQSSALYPPGLISHTLTAVGDNWLYVIGGSAQNNSMTSGIYRFPILAGGGGRWEKVVPRGGRDEERRFVGHSAVYHPESKSILVYGGYKANYGEVHKRSTYLHAYHVVENYWTKINYNRGSEDTHEFVPRSLAYHTATIIGNYMVVFGGTSHIHEIEQLTSCYDKKIYAFHLGCYQWVNLQKLSPQTGWDLFSTYSLLLLLSCWKAFFHLRNDNVFFITIEVPDMLDF